MGQMVKILLEEQQMSFPTCEEIKRVEVDANVLNEIVGKENSTFSKQKKMKKEVYKTIPKMTLWGDVHEKVKNEKFTPISKVDETILKLMEMKEQPM